MVPVCSVSSRSRTIGCSASAASSSITSPSRAAAFPVGAHSATRGKLSDVRARAASILATVYVLPVPGPPATTVSLPVRALTAAACCCARAYEVDHPFLVPEVTLEVEAIAVQHERLLSPAVADHRATRHCRHPILWIRPGKGLHYLRRLALDHHRVPLRIETDAYVPEAGAPNG